MHKMHPFALVFLIGGLVVPQAGGAGRVTAPVKANTGPTVPGQVGVVGAAGLGQYNSNTVGALAVNQSGMLTGTLGSVSAAPSARVQVRQGGVVQADPALRLGVQPNAGAVIVRPEVNPGQSAAQVDGAAVSRKSGSGALVPQRGAPQGDPSIGSVQSARQELGAAREAETKGDSGALSRQINTMFDGIQVEAPGGANVPDDAGGVNTGGTLGTMVEAAPLNPADYGADPTEIGVEQAATRLSRTGNSVAAAEAPLFYDVAAETARGGGETALADKIVAQARKRGTYQVVDSVRRQAVASAVAGDNAATKRFARGVYAWNKVLSREGRPHITNYEEFRGDLAAIEAYKKANPGRKLDVSGSAFTPRGDQLVYQSFRRGAAAEQIKSVPADLLAEMELALIANEAAWMPALTAAAEASPADSFRGEAQAGLRALAARHGWAVAIGMYLKRTVLDWVRQLWADVLAFFSGAAQMSLDLAAVPALRAQPALAVAVNAPQGRRADDLGLGIQLQ